MPAITKHQGTAEALEQRPSVYAWYALGLLTLVYVLNFLDRTLIYLLLTPIKKEIAVSDLQLALLGATSFAIFYTSLGIPFGRLADRVVRKNMIAVGLATWSLFSGLTGFCNGFWTMFFCRLMVGVGEATLGPAALSLLSDYFPPRMRATVQGIYSSGIAIGSGFAFFLGGWIGQNYGWRWAFYFLGFPGLLLAVVVFFLREQRRGQTEVAAVSYTSKDWKILFQSVPLRYLYLGYALFGLASNNLGIWVPSFFVRAHGMSLVLIGTVAGILSVVVGVPVTIFGGYASDRFRRFGKGGRMLFSTCAALASVPLWLVLLFSDSTALLLILNFVLFGLAHRRAKAARARIGCRDRGAGAVAPSRLPSLAILPPRPRTPPVPACAAWRWRWSTRNPARRCTSPRAAHRSGGGAQRCVPGGSGTPPHAARTARPGS